MRREKREYIDIDGIVYEVFPKTRVVHILNNDMAAWEVRLRIGEEGLKHDKARGGMKRGKLITDHDIILECKKKYMKKHFPHDRISNFFTNIDKGRINFEV